MIKKYFQFVKYFLIFLLPTEDEIMFKFAISTENYYLITLLNLHFFINYKIRLYFVSMFLNKKKKIFTPKN